MVPDPRWRMGLPMTVPIEIRRNDDGAIDEIVASDCRYVQIEQLSDSSWHMEIAGTNGATWLFVIGARNGRSHVKITHTETN